MVLSKDGGRAYEVIKESCILPMLRTKSLVPLGAYSHEGKYLIVIFDTRWAEIHYELWALREHLSSIERHLKVVEPQGRELLFAELREKGFDDDEAEVSLAHQEFWELTENVLPRYFRGSFLVVLWAVFESAVVEIASHLIRNNGKLGIREINETLKQRGIRGKNTLDIIKKYYEHILGVQMFPLDQDLSNNRIEILLDIRNAIAHGNGRKDAVNNKMWKKIEKWQKANVGIQLIRNDFVSFDDIFLEETYCLVNNYITDLIVRVKEHQLHIEAEISVPR